MTILVLSFTFLSQGAVALTCDIGGLNQDDCRINDANHDITGEEITASGTDIIVESGGRLYTDHVTQSATNDASIELTDGDFIVESGGAVHANINITAYNIKVEEGGVIDATGLGWQAPVDNSPPCEFGSYTSDQKGDLCYGGGPAGGVSGTGNSNKGAGGGGHGGKGGSFKNSNAYAHGGGYGPTNSDTYGNNGSQKGPATFGSAGGAQADTYLLSNSDGYSGHGDASDWTGARGDKILNATYGNGDKDDPDSDPLDSDRWISTDVEYRKNNPAGDIRMSSGGGRIKLVANNKVNVSGYLLSNGLDGFGSEGSSGYSPGGGAGGSIWIASGGIFGKGSVRADGGTYMELVDGQQDVFSGGGGGGRVYYAYSIKGDEWGWTTTANEGEGGVDLDTGWGGNTNGNLAKGEVATPGTVFSRIAFSANINDSIVNPNEPIHVNGTASSLVTVTINGTVVGTVEPRSSDGYYNTTVNSLHFNETDNLGNYTMSVSSTISGQSITEKFDISHREVEIYNQPDFFLKAEEDLQFSNTSELIKENGAGGSEHVPYSNQELNFTYYNQSQVLNDSTITTDSSGDYSVFHGIRPTKGRKWFTIQTENENGIDDTIYDDDIYNINNRSLAWVDINDSIVDPEDAIKVNGTAHNDVYVYLENQNNNFEHRATLTPGPEGYYETSVKSLDINDPTDFGNYTLRLKTKINGANRTEKFEISHREIEIFNDPDYLLKAGEDLSLSNDVNFYKEDPANYNNSVTKDYENGFTFRLLNQSSEVTSRGIDTSGGTYSLTQNIQPTPGFKQYRLREINSNGITETVEDQDLYENEEKDLAWVDINTSIVDPGQNIQINGSAHNLVTFELEKPNGNFIDKGSVSPNAEGYFEVSKQSLTRSVIDSEQDIGNYTLRVNTSLNGQVRTEKFNISHREIEIDNNPDFFLKAGENLQFGNFTDLIKQDGEGGKTRVNYSTENITYNYFNQSSLLNETNITTNSSGGYSVFQELQPTSGRKRFTLETENENQVNDLITDDDLYNINNRSLAWVDINDSIVDPEDAIKVNGTAHNDVYVYLENQNNNFEHRATLTPGPEGYYETSVKSLDINDPAHFGNYTLKVETELNGKVRTEIFEVSHREIEVFNDPDYFLKAGESLSLDNHSFFYRENKSDPDKSAKVPYEDGFTFKLFNQSVEVVNNPISTIDHTYSFNQKIDPTPGHKKYRIREINENGITETVEDDDLYDEEEKELAWVDINTSVVDPGQYIKVNGSSHSDISVYLESPDGDFINRGTFGTDGTGFFSVPIQSLTRSEIDSYDDLGNYTLRIETELNGKVRKESFNISHREVEFYHDTDYLLRPGESFTISGNANRTRADGTGGSYTEPYVNRDFQFQYMNGTTEIRGTTESTDSNGNLSISDSMVSQRGKKYYVIEHVNENGINYLRSDNDLNDNSRKNLGLVDINDSIVNPGDPIKVNGTVYDQVEITFNNTEVEGSPVTPDSSNGYFNNTFTVPEFRDAEALGNQTLRVNTSLNGKERSETFQVSMRGLWFDLDSSYSRRVEPNENFTVSGEVTKYIENGTGGSKPVNYTDEEIRIIYKDVNGKIQEKTTTTDGSGEFSIEDFKSPPNAGDRTIEISTVNNDGIRRRITRTVKTQIRVFGGSSTSPSKRLFKDYNLKRTRFVNPDEDVDFEVTTRKSLDFVQRVYANVTLPNGDMKQVELTERNLLGRRLDSAEEFDGGETTHLSHFSSLGNLSDDRLRIGYEERPGDELLLDMPLESDVSGEVTDTSDSGNDASPNGDISKGESGVFSTDAIRFNGGNLEIPDSKSLDLTSEFTVSAWIKTTQDGTVYSRADYLGNNINPEVFVEGGDAKVRVTREDGTSYTAVSSSTVSDGDWHHVVGRYNGSHIEIGVDGALENSVEVLGDIPSHESSVLIGESGTSSANNFIGKIDQIKVFNSSISDSRVEKLGSTRGSFEIPVTTERALKDKLKVLNFLGDLNNQTVSLEVLSDYDSDDVYEESSDTIEITPEHEISSVTGIGNFSKDFKLNISLESSNISESPTVSQVDLKARKDNLITWRKSKSVEDFFDTQYGNYSVVYGALDYASNLQDNVSETSNFTVRNLIVKADHKGKVEPGEELSISGNVTMVKGDGSGGEKRVDYTDELNILYADMIKGQNYVHESVKFENKTTGDTETIYVNGSKNPTNTAVTFFGSFAGIDESIVWNNSSDWDNFSSRTGLTHSDKGASPLDNTILTLGYSSQDLGRSELTGYYAMDNAGDSLTDSADSTSMDAVGSPETSSSGIASTSSVSLSGSDGFSSTVSPFDNSGSFTINAWIKPVSIPDSSGSLGSGPGSPYTIFAVEDSFTFQVVEGGNVYAALDIGGDTFEVSTSEGNIEPGKWNMVTVKYNDGNDKFRISSGKGNDEVSVDVGPRPDLTGSSSFVGYRSDIGENGFEGKMDELRLYERGNVNTLSLRSRIGDLDPDPVQQEITMASRNFSEGVRTESLVLKADSETRNQDIRVYIDNNGGGTSDVIDLTTERSEYPITGLDDQDAERFDVRIEMDGNVTAAPALNSLRLVRRYSTENPGIDIDGDMEHDANFTGRIPKGSKETVALENLSTGANTVNFSTKNGVYDAVINFTEVMVGDSQDAVNVDSSGDFSTSFTAPEIGGLNKLRYYITNERGIHGRTETTATTKLQFNYSKIQDMENGDRILDPNSTYKINATLKPHTNSLERVWADIGTPGGISHEVDFSKNGEVWMVEGNVEDIYDGIGVYNFTLRARDVSGIREINAPELSFNVTRGVVMVDKSDEIVGLNRSFNVSGVVKSEFSGENRNASVNISIPFNGFSTSVETNDSGFYRDSLEAPGEQGNFTIELESEDEKNVTGYNSTEIEVRNSTSISIEVPESVEASNVDTETGENKTFELNITNDGFTDAKDVEVYSTNLPTVDGKKWKSVNRTYDVGSGETKTVEAEVWIKAGAPFGTYEGMELGARFETTEEVVKETSTSYDIKIAPNKKPLWQENKSVVKYEGFSGSILNSSSDIMMQNEGTTTANDVTWSMSDSRIKAWTKGFKPPQDPGAREIKSDLGSGGEFSLSNWTIGIPHGTAPGNYTVYLQSESQDPTETNKAEVEVEVPNKPTYVIELIPTKGDVVVPEGEINMSNPIQAGQMATGTTAGELFNISLNNTGNRDLEWTISREQEGVRRILFDPDDSGTAEEGTETRQSNTTLNNEENYTYTIPDRTQRVLYSVASDADSEVYKANVTISCNYPIGGDQSCVNGSIVLPLNGTVTDPEPYFTEGTVNPNVTGVGSSVDMTVNVKDNKQLFIEENDPVNATIIKDLDGEREVKEINDVPVDYPDDVALTFTPTKVFDEGTEDSQEPDEYCVKYTAMDSSGQKSTSPCYNFTVKQSAHPVIDRNKTEVTLKNVTAETGDIVQIAGEILSDNTTAYNLNISFSTDAPSKFDWETSEINVGELPPRSKTDFNVTLDSVSNIDPLKSFTAFVETKWTDPDGKSRQPDWETSSKEVRITIKPNKILDIGHGSSDSITVGHNRTESEVFWVESRGNDGIKDVSFDCVQCANEIYISGFNRSGFDMSPGERVPVGYNITVEPHVGEQTVARDIEAEYSSGTKFLNETIVTVPEDRSVEVSPNKVESAIPKGEGDVNITSITTRNVGNAELDLRLNVNDSGADIYLGTEKSQNSYTYTVAPGKEDEVKLHSDTETISLGSKFYQITPSDRSGVGLDSVNKVNLSLVVQDIGMNIEELNKTDQIVEGDSLELKVNMTKRDEPINATGNVDLVLESGNTTLNISESYNSTSKFWNSEFEAPDLEDGMSHDYRISATSSAYTSDLSTLKTVSYKDVTPPQFVNFTSEAVRAGNSSTIHVELEDRSEVNDVSGRVIGPSENDTLITLENVSEEEFETEFNKTDGRGLYNVTLTAEDAVGNKQSQIDYFRVFEPLKVEGDAMKPVNETRIELVDRGGDVSDTVSPENDTYDTTVKSGEYAQARVRVDEGKKAILEEFNSSKISQDPPKFDASIDEKMVDIDDNYLDGYALESSTFEEVDGLTVFDYSDFIASIDSLSNLQIMKCDDYNITEAEPCKSGYEPVPSGSMGIDLESNRVVTNITGFSSYLLVERESETGLKNLTGKLSNLEDLSNLDDLLQDISSGISDIDTGTGTSDSSGSGSSPLPPIDPVDSGKDNRTEDTNLAIGIRKISLQISPGQSKSTVLSLQNPSTGTKSIDLEATPNLRNITEFNSSFELEAGEFRTVKIEVDAENITRLREFSGFIRIASNKTSHSVPVNIDVVSSENRLLDLSLEPTLDSFNPGDTARFKLSFSNQGFTRAVDAETTVKILDIAENNTLAKISKTYAIQTTLDKVVDLNIPEGTELGEYEVRAVAEYSNIPGNRSATSVAQITIAKPYWNQELFGLQKSMLLILAILLIAGLSGGGYLYYWYKAQKEKEKRFKEQVDVDEIPDETGRTAFIGKLAEIDTRTFINLDDLMTHSIIAGATGGGKSVAAQDIVEEALEQGVNVIVLDPTGQWSGFLEENEKDEMFVFYDDFGMSKNNARSYEGNIRAVEADQDTVDITDVLRPDEDEGSIHVFSMHKLENEDLEEYISDTIQQIFDYNPEEKDELKTLIVYDEAHRVLPKFGGTGKGTDMLERGAREFRKWGIGMIVISQVIEDFPEQVRANVATKIQMRTEFEGDLDRIERKYGNNIMKGVVKSDTGTGMVQNSSYNHGKPYFVDFRPLRHSPERLGDDVLDKIEKYNRQVDDLEEKIDKLRDQDKDVFEYESQLKLIKKNIRKRSFRLVDTYIEELDESLDEELR